MWPGTISILDIQRFHVIIFSQYPAYDSFLSSVREEAIQNVKRLRHHPSVVIFGACLVEGSKLSPAHCHNYLAGNNEGKAQINLTDITSSCTLHLDYQIAESLNLELDYSDETSDYRKTNFPARFIYERVLPSVVDEYSNIYYHRASPYSGQGKPTTDKTLGDLHQCWYSLKRCMSPCSSPYV